MLAGIFHAGLNDKGEIVQASAPFTFPLESFAPGGEGPGQVIKGLAFNPYCVFQAFKGLVRRVQRCRLCRHVFISFPFKGVWPLFALVIYDYHDTPAALVMGCLLCAGDSPRR